MRIDLERRLTAVAFLAMTSALGPGCTPAPEDAADGEASTDEVVDVDHTLVKRQFIGNCWLYATASWAESLAKSAGAGELDMSETYWTYWHWFDQIANGGVASEIQTGGWYATAVEIIARYGIMMEGEFIPSEATAEGSQRQKDALAKVNASLKTGALSTRAARRDRALVRRELDAAFQLEPPVVEQLDEVFGSDVSRTLDRSSVSTDTTSIRRARSIAAQLRDPETKDARTLTLEEAIGKRGAYGTREGAYAWNMENYAEGEARRAILARVQRAMHDRQPVIMSWYVDFKAMDKEGRFLAPPPTPGSQGGHMVVVEDYQITDVPGFGTLTAGTIETRPEALEAALSPSASIEFFRVKNSWGTRRAPDVVSPIAPGYHDLYMRYLDGPMKHCRQENNQSTDDCWLDTPLYQFVLPAGY